MMEGLATVWLRDAEGRDAPTDGAVAERTEDHEKQVVIFRVETERGELHLVFRRGELSAALAHPNTGNEVDVVINDGDEE